MNQNPNPNPNLNEQGMGIPGQNGDPTPHPYWQGSNEWRPYIAPEKTNLRETGNKRDLIYAGILFVLSLLCMNFFFYGGCGIAFAVTSMGLFCGGLLYLLPHRRGGSGYMVFCILSYLLCGLSLILSDSGLGAFLSVCTMLVLSGITLMEYMSLGREQKGTIRCVSDWFHTTFALSFGNIGAAFYALFRKKGEEGVVEKRKINAILIGLLCAVPVLLIVIPLLMGADGAFEGLMDKLSVDRGKELPVTLIFGISLFILFFAQLFASRFRKTEEKPRERTARKGIDIAFLVTFFSVICLVYVLYLVSQLAYFFNAFKGLLPEEFTVAQYARRGFFEMTAVCVVNLGLLFFAILGAGKKDDGEEPWAIRVVAIFLCLFSLVLVATAMSKMNLYIRSFGMTYLRLVTSVFMIFLCVVFCTMFLWIFRRKLPYMRIIVITATVLVLCVSFADPARVVADYNVKAYQTGKLDSIDMTELQILGSDAVVPYVWELRTDPDPQVAEKAWRILYERGKDYDFFKGDGHEYFYDWRGFNVMSYEAYNLYLENWEEIYNESLRLGIVPKRDRITIGE